MTSLGVAKMDRIPSIDQHNKIAKTGYFSHVTPSDIHQNVWNRQQEPESQQVDDTVIDEWMAWRGSQAHLLDPRSR